MSRGRMTMRAELERNTAAGTDPYGGPVPAVFTPLATVPCFVWSRQKREVVDGVKTVVIEDMRAIFPLTADVRATDEIARVTDRQGNQVIAGRLRVMTDPQRKHRHQEAMLERVN